MKNFNVISGIVLAIISVLAVMANYFNMVATLITGISTVLSVLISFIAIMQVYHYQCIQDHNPGKFWFIYSIIAGVILIIVGYASVFNLVSERFSASIMFVLPSLLFPTIGVCIGNIARILLKAEQPVI